MYLSKLTSAMEFLVCNCNAKLTRYLCYGLSHGFHHSGRAEADNLADVVFIIRYETLYGIISIKSVIRRTEEQDVHFFGQWNSDIIRLD